MMDETQCNIYITEPNGVRVSVAKAINCGDFQAERCCIACNKPCTQDDNW